MDVKEQKILIAIAEGYHDHEFWFPYYRFREAGAQVIVVGPQKGSVLGEGRHGKDGLRAEVEYTTKEAAQMDFDGLFLTGGIFGPLALRADPSTMDIVKKADEMGKWIGAICHAPWILISAGVVAGRRISCPFDMACDLTAAGGIYVPHGAVQDGNLYTAEYFRYLPELFQLILA